MRLANFPCVRPQPQTSFFLILTPRWLLLFSCLFARIQATSVRSSGPQRCSVSTCRGAAKSRVGFSLVWLHSCAQRTRSNTSRAAPKTFLFPSLRNSLLTPCFLPLFSRRCDYQRPPAVPNTPNMACTTTPRKPATSSDSGLPRSEHHHYSLAASASAMASNRYCNQIER